MKINLAKTPVNIVAEMFAKVQFSIKRLVGVSKVLITKKIIVIKGQLSGVYTMS